MITCVHVVLPDHKWYCTLFPFAEAIQNKTNHQAVEKELAQATKKIEQESEVRTTIEP